MAEYISREAARDLMEQALVDEWEIQYADDRLDELPAADVEKVRHGRWVWDENGRDWGLGAWKCSECHRKPETWWEADKGNPYRCAGSRYCNHCGAKMDGGEE